MRICECKKCVHYEVCNPYVATNINFPNVEKCDHYKDKSLFVELLCKMGDTVYQTDGERIYETTIDEIDLMKDNIIYCTKNIWFDKTAIGKTVFLTKEEAERKLEELGV